MAKIKDELIGKTETSEFIPRKKNKYGKFTSKN